MVRTYFVVKTDVFILPNCVSRTKRLAVDLCALWLLAFFPEISRRKINDVPVRIFFMNDGLGDGGFGRPTKTQRDCLTVNFSHEMAPVSQGCCRAHGRAGRDSSGSDSRNTGPGQVTFL